MPKKPLTASDMARRRWAKTTPKQRTEAARLAAAARWKGHKKQAKKRSAKIHA